MLLAKKCVFVLLLAGICLSATAEKWTNGNLLVKNIIWRPGYHGFYVEHTTYHDPDNCSTGPKQYLYVFDAATEADAKTMDRLFTLLTTAMVSNKRIHAFVKGCRGGFPVVTGLQLNN